LTRLDFTIMSIGENRSDFFLPLENNEEKVHIRSSLFLALKRKNRETLSERKHMDFSRHIVKKKWFFRRKTLKLRRKWLLPNLS